MADKAVEKSGNIANDTSPVVRADLFVFIVKHVLPMRALFSKVVFFA